jgi:hypothetical protein
MRCQRFCLGSAGGRLGNRRFVAGPDHTKSTESSWQLGGGEPIDGQPLETYKLRQEQRGGNASLRFAIAGTIGEEFLMDGQV